jgi:solute carrier family 25 phosphate transporter 23/24/25/41
MSKSTAQSTAQPTESPINKKSTPPTTDYEKLFHKLDVQKSGEITLRDFKLALKKLNHPIHDNSELVQKNFQLV